MPGTVLGVERTIVLLVADGFTDSGLSVALDVLRTANAVMARSGQAPAFRIEVASARGGSVRAASGMELARTRTLRIAARADVVLAPGLWVEDAAQLDAALAARAAARSSSPTRGSSLGARRRRPGGSPPI